MQVVFNASGNQVHQEQFAIDVEDRDPDIHPTGIPVALIGESCIPGIIVDDVDGIFEEHSIRKEIDPYYTHSTQYGVAEKVLQTHWWKCMTIWLPRTYCICCETLRE